MEKAKGTPNINANRIGKAIVSFIKEYSVLVVVVLVGAVFTIGNRNFLTADNFFTIMRQSAIMGIAGIGCMFCMITGSINLAVGSFMSMVTVLVAIWSVNWGQSWVVGMVLAVIVSTIIGFVQGFVTIKGKVNPMIASLAFKTMLAGGAYLISGGLPIYGIPEESKILGQGKVGPVPVPAIVLVIVAIIVAIFFNKTYMGRKFFAAGSNDEAARLSGIKTQKLRVSAFTVCGFLCGIAGIIQLGRMGSGQPAAGSEVEMNVLTAIVIGGVSVGGGEGKVFKAFCGVFLINELINGMTLLNISLYWQQVTQGAIFLFAILLDSYQHRVVVKKKVANEFKRLKEENKANS